MQSTTPELLALFNEQPEVMYMVDLYTITLVGGQVLRYTNADRAISFGGHTWLLGPLLSRNSVKQTRGIQVDALDVDMHADASVQVNGQPLMQFIGNGGFDGADLLLERAFGRSPDEPIVGTLIRFLGRIGPPEVTNLQASLQVKSHTMLLDVQVPRDVFQAGCPNTLYDGACGINRASRTVSGAVTATEAPTESSFTHALAQAAGYFDLGVVTFTSGANAGVSRTIRAHTSGRFQLIAPFPYAPDVGDTFTAYPGCNKTMAMCGSKFSNLQRFRGQPFVPVPETVA